MEETRAEKQSAYHAPQPRPDSLQPWKFMDPFAEGSLHARIIIGLWAGPVRTRQQPGGHAAPERQPQPACPITGDIVRGAELRETWVRWATERSPDDCATLLRSLRPMVYHLAQKRFQTDVEDLVQQTMVEVLKGRSAPRNELWSYVESIVRSAYDRTILRPQYDAPNGGSKLTFVSDSDGVVANEIQERWSEESDLRRLSTRHLQGRLRDISELLQMGFTKRQIASRFKVTVRTVERIIAEHCKPAGIVPAMSASAQCAVRLRVIIRPRPDQRAFLHNVQQRMAA